jgi:hypothetical protein
MFQAIGCIILAQDNLVYFCYASICFPPCGKPSVCKDAAAPEMVYNQAAFKRHLKNRRCSFRAVGAYSACITVDSFV